MSVKQIEIAGRKIGPGEPCFIIAEAGINHNGDMNLAYQLIDAAVQAGADAVKFQTFRTDLLVTPDAPKADYQVQGTGETETQYDMLRRVELSFEAHRDLMNFCRERRILFMSTPFDHESVDLLAGLDVAVFKIPSGEITNLPLLTYLACKGRPLIVSTGMSDLGEVETAVRTIEATGNRDFALLHCVSNYPADPVDVNLRAMRTMEIAFGVPVGYSDHTLGVEISLAARALGACVIEKHFTLDKTLPGPDHQASLEPDELAALVQGVRKVDVAMGDGRKMPVASEINTAIVARKSLVAGADLPAGTVLTKDMIAIMRPGTGLPPAMQRYLIGRTLNKSVRKGTLLTLEIIS